VKISGFAMGKILWRSLMMKARIPASPRVICRWSISAPSSDFGNGLGFLRLNRNLLPDFESGAASDEGAGWVRFPHPPDLEFLLAKVEKWTV
jgi:hypothetical protein